MSAYSRRRRASVAVCRLLQAHRTSSTHSMRAARCLPAAWTHASRERAGPGWPSCCRQCDRQLRTGVWCGVVWWGSAVERSALHPPPLPQRGLYCTVCRSRMAAPEAAPVPPPCRRYAARACAAPGGWDVAEQQAPDHGPQVVRHAAPAQVPQRVQVNLRHASVHAGAIAERKSSSSSPASPALPSGVAGCKRAPELQILCAGWRKRACMQHLAARCMPGSCAHHGL